MNSVECEFEVQALAAVLEERWPVGVEASLREHVSACPICSDVVVIADTFTVARRHSHAGVALPDSSRVWWMAQIRARREAAAEAARPILATQIAACAWAVGLLAVCLGAALTWFQFTRGWIGSLISVASTLLVTHGVLIAIATAIVLLLPTAAYFSLGKE